MHLYLYNTLTRKKEEFQPKDPKRVTLYTCGPTVYDFAHIGNFRAYIFEDILRRYLEYKGCSVQQVMNLTDVDDKTIKGARMQNKGLSDYTACYKQAFFDDIRTLNIEPAETYPAATDHVTEMVQIIEVLLEKGYAYKSDDNCIYFNIRKFKEYGKLAHINLGELKAGARVRHDEYEKEHASDFALWKAWDKDDGEVFWESPFGRGRPGWHIECSAMSMKHLSQAFSQGSFDPSLFETIDLHTGGVDNKFPHHEDEIAQSEAATGKTFVSFWLHCEHLLVDEKKMSKSLGNYYTLRDLLQKGYSPKSIRYQLLSTHYRQQLNFTLEELKASENAISRMQDFVWNVMSAHGENIEIEEFLTQAKDDFELAMDDDLNMPQALAAIFTFIKDINILIAEGKLDKDNTTDILAFLRQINNVLGILEFEKEALPKDIETLIQKREEARKNKDFPTADYIRKELEKAGIILDDTPQGVRWKRK
ncbi:MAG: cysteine--tRNA ligase [Nanoarchaeota archaeon]